MKNRRMLSAIMALFLVFAMIPSVYATSNCNSEELEYAIERVEHFLYRENYSPTNDLSLSNSIPLYNLDSEHEITGDVYFVFDGNKNIGTLLVSTIKDQYYSTFYMSDYASVSQAFANSQSITLGSYDNSFLLFNEGDLYILENPDDKSIRIDAGEITGMSSTPIHQNAELHINTKVRSKYYNLSVPFVDNAASPVAHSDDNGKVTYKGLCWAACAASKINYTKGKSLTALDVFNALWATVNYDESQEPVGEDSWVSKLINIYGEPFLTRNGHLSTNRICTFLADNEPVIAVIYGKNTQGKTVGHALVLNSFDEDAEYYELSFMDPNISNKYVYISYSHSDLDDGTGFYYKTAWGSVYTEWRKTWY